MVVFFIVMLVFRGGTKTFSQRCVWTFCSHLNFHHEKDIDSKEFWGTELGQMFFLWRIRIISIGWYWHFSLDICKDVTMMFLPSLPWLFLRWFPFETPGNMTWNLGSHTHTHTIATCEKHLADRSSFLFLNPNGSQFYLMRTCYVLLWTNKCIE